MDKHVLHLKKQHQISYQAIVEFESDKSEQTDIKRYDCFMQKNHQDSLLPGFCLALSHLGDGLAYQNGKCYLFLPQADTVVQFNYDKMDNNIFCMSLASAALMMNFVYTENLFPMSDTAFLVSTVDAQNSTIVRYATADSTDGFSQTIAYHFNGNNPLPDSVVSITNFRGEMLKKTVKYKLKNNAFDFQENLRAALKGKTILDEKSLPQILNQCGNVTDLQH